MKQKWICSKCSTENELDLDPASLQRQREWLVEWTTPKNQKTYTIPCKKCGTNNNVTVTT